VKWEMAKPRLNPAQILAIGFLIAIAVGTVLLSLPQAAQGSDRLSIIDALFTATSAVCVTGLKVVDTGSHFSLLGQVVILMLIQFGGLGIMTMVTLFAAMLGRRITIRDRLVVQEALKHSTSEGVLVLLKYVLVLTIVIEGVGAGLLYLRWAWDGSVSHPVYYAIFHSVSAFCNAGFSLFRDSFIGYQGDVGINLIVLFLIVFGGLGFTVLLSLRRYIFKRHEAVSLQAKVVLSMTGILILVGTAVLFLLESRNTLSALPFGRKVLGACFQAITPRTAGFNTIDIGSLTTSSLFFLMALMFIGGSPGSTAGGIKISTFGIFLASTYSLFRGKKNVTFFRRTIPGEVIRKVTVIFTLSLGMVILSTFLLSLTEHQEFYKLVFEVFSAFGTVGLSTGITQELSYLGRLIITITMFIGRIGPLTIAVAMGEKEYRPLYKYPEERVMIG
jgi:trk system potassium uptake protein TrkH